MSENIWPWKTFYTKKKEDKMPRVLTDLQCNKDCDRCKYFYVNKDSNITGAF